MKRLAQSAVVAGVASLLLFGSNTAQAQGRGNFDPAQMRERMMERYREQLEITNDSEWNAISPLIQKVTEARMTVGFGGMGRGMFGRGPRPGGDTAQGDQRQRQRRGFGGEPDPAAEALQKAIDDKASNAELKAALDKYLASRKAKQAELAEAQANLRKVLTPRQEAIATLMGLVNQSP